MRISDWSSDVCSSDLPPASLVERLRTLLTTYLRAGGARALLLAHDARHGADLIALMARHGDGLPANVLPFAVNQITQIGFDFLASAFAYGAARIVILAPPSKRDETTGLAGPIGIGARPLTRLGYRRGRVRPQTGRESCRARA